MEQSISQGMFFSVTCAEDAPFITDEAIAREAKGTWFGDTAIRNMLRACKVWPKGTVPEGYREPVTSSVPTLLLVRRAGPGDAALVGRGGEEDAVAQPARGGARAWATTRWRWAASQR